MWWTIWLVTTVGTPIGILAVGAHDNPRSSHLKEEVALLVTGLFIHAIACRKLDQRSQQYLIPMLLLGGWGVMLAVFTTGCMALLGSSLH